MTNVVSFTSLYSACPVPDTELRRRVMGVFCELHAVTKPELAQRLFPSSNQTAAKRWLGPTLKWLEDRQFIQVTPRRRGPARVYRATQHGRQHAEWSAVFDEQGDAG